MRIGVLALPGGFALHARALARCGAEAVEVRKPAELEGLDGLVIPGGESTTLLKLMEAWGFVAALPGVPAAGRPGSRRGWGGGGCWRAGAGCWSRASTPS